VTTGLTASFPLAFTAQHTLHHGLDSTTHPASALLGAGFTLNRRHYLHIEEAAYLVDRADLMLFVELASDKGVQTICCAQLSAMFRV
jgi:hypothetical protein